MQENPGTSFVDEPGAGSSSDNLAEVRGWGERQEKARKEAEKEARQAKERAQKLSERVLKATFKEAGLPENLANLYAKVNDNFDPEALTADEAVSFAKEYGIPVQGSQTPAQGTEETPAQTDQPSEPVQVQSPEEVQGAVNQALTGTPIVPQGGSSPAPNPVTSAEIWKAAMNNDMAKVNEIVAREMKQPGTIKYTHPDHVKDIE